MFDIYCKYKIYCMMYVFVCVCQIWKNLPCTNHFSGSLDTIQIQILRCVEHNNLIIFLLGSHVLDSAPGLSLQPAESRPMETGLGELSLGSLVNLPMSHDYISLGGWGVGGMPFSLPWLWPINHWLIVAIDSLSILCFRSQSAEWCLRCQ